MIRRFGIQTAILMLTLSASGGAWPAPSADLWPFWQASDESSTARVDHGPWQALLHTYVVTREDGSTRVRYRAVTDADRQRLDDYVDRLAAIDPRTLSRARQLPYWINLYNALTVRVVLDHPDEDSIRGMGRGLFSFGPWDDELVTIAGQAVTLNDIEHRILRPIWQDRRIHYAVNCASVGCPNLAAQAYTRENAWQLMDEGERHYLHHPRGLHFDDAGRLHASRIFDWYLADFGGTREALLAYFARQRPDLAARLRGYDGRIDYQYDWSLNGAGTDSAR